MKKIYKSIFFLVGITFVISSCDFDVKNYQDIPTEDAYTNVQDVQNGMNGAYNAFGDYRFYGRNVVAVGDMAADISQADQSAGHFWQVYRYIITDSNTELNDIWTYGYKVIDRCIRTIQGAEAVKAQKATLHLDDEDIAKIDLYISQCYSLRALTNFTLVNIFASPYQKGTEKMGIPLLIDKPLEPFVNISRSTVGKVYELILSDIVSAKSHMEGALNYNPKLEPNAFYLNPGAISALEARVNLYMGNDVKAKEAAQEAIDWKGTAFDKPSDEAYVSMWTAIAITEEDIFTIAKNDNDNLSANALNTLYNSYDGALQANVTALFGVNDIRKDLIDGNHPRKFDGTSTSEAVSNIPVFRKSEMYLIIAEAEARAGNITEAQDALFYTAKRDLAITDAIELPATKDALLKFISQERVREFFTEGHRFFDARRTGEIITVAGNKPNFDISSLLYPIPLNEINAGFMTEQNEGWSTTLP